MTGPTPDLVIRGGVVVDGNGGPERHADVAVVGDTIVAVGDVEQKGRREIDADGALVAPGWVDVHTHYDGQATWDQQLAPSSVHGVTTVVMGNCGVGFAPVRSQDHQQLIELMEGVEDIPGAALHEGLKWNWSTFGEYLDAVDSIPHDIDVAAQVPHGALRLFVMGQRGADGDKATREEIEEMAELAKEAIVEGALGFTTSRTLNHRTSRGEPTPTLKAARDELVGIARGVGRAGTGVLQLVSDFIDVADEFGNLRAMVEASGRPASFTLVQSPRDPNGYRGMLQLLDEAHADGLEIRGQVATRGIGLLLGLQGTLNPFMANPVYQQVADLDAPARVAVMGDPAFKARLLAADEGQRDKSKVGGGIVRMFENMFVLGDPPDYEPDPSSNVAAEAGRAGREPLEFVYDLLLRDSGRLFLYIPALNYVDGRLDGVREMLLHPQTIPGLSDGGAHVGTISDGSFPTTLLAHWCRDRDGEQLTVPFVVQSQCRDTAWALGMRDRGVLAPGYKADINVIDLERLSVSAPEMHYDLPAGGRRLLQGATGYLHTIVSGVPTYESGVSTGEFPGRLVRGARSIRS
ncbi:MAG: amidohydrolase family protein [Rhodococcus sp. (in: high G+C Gram-positive bacteria)]